MHQKQRAMDEQFAKVKTGGLRLKGEKVKTFFCKLPGLPQIQLSRVYYHQVKKHKKHKKSKKREHEDGGGEDENVKRSKKDFKEDSIKNGGW